MADEKVTQEYARSLPLKYGVNPHQAPSALYHIASHGKLPFKVLNGTPGYINLCDALNAWQLVKELRQALNLPAAASFKHVSPAGAAVAVPLTAEEKEAYEIGDKPLTQAALSYLRARQADPMCSFGDFAALSDPVDEATANILKTEVSDGIIAPGYSEEAFKILASKKGGKYIILEMDPNYEAPEIEYREIYGVCFAQRRNTTLITSESLNEVKTKNKDLTPEAIRDMILASITVKYTQSNSVGYAWNGMMIGVGAGQQSRVDCCKLAGRKVEVWYLRQHPKVRGLKFKESVKRQERINARVRYIEGDFTGPEKAQWETLFTEVPEPLTQEEKTAFLQTLTNVSLSSDAFFPFRDSIDQISKRGVKYVAQPGGSVADEEVINACNEYDMVMSFTGVRLFHH